MYVFQSALLKLSWSNCVNCFHKKLLWNVCIN